MHDRQLDHLRPANCSRIPLHALTIKIYDMLEIVILSSPGSSNEKRYVLFSNSLTRSTEGVVATRVGCMILRLVRHVSVDVRICVFMLDNAGPWQLTHTHTV
jgi:hypothetical protein